MNLPRFVATLLLGLVLLLGTRAAHAQRKHADAGAEVPKTEASQVKSAADALMDQDRYADALALYERAYELSNDPALLYNQGRAYEALGDYPAALSKLDLFERDAPAAVRARVPGLHDLITDLRGRIATLVVRTNAPGARLLVRQKDEGAVNGEKRLAMRAGTARIEVDAEGYERFSREVELAGGATVEVDARLVSKKREAVVMVRTSPNADLQLDGKPLGRAPLQIRAAPGAHELVARVDGYHDERVPMTLALGEHRDVDLHMRSTPGIASKWWFWTGIGVVVLGGAATAYALTTEKPHGSGSFNPGSVAGP
jgi:hypothetical protein